MKKHNIALGDIAETPALVDFLHHGSQEEIRQAIGSIGVLIRTGIWRAAPEEREWLGAALEAIGKGEKPHVALGLNTKRKPLGDLLARQSSVDELHALGMALEEARSLAARYDYRAGAMADDPDDNAGESLRAATRRVKKRRTK